MTREEQIRQRVIAQRLKKGEPPIKEKDYISWVEIYAKELYDWMLKWFEKPLDDSPNEYPEEILFYQHLDWSNGLECTIEVRRGNQKILTDKKFDVGVMKTVMERLNKHAGFQATYQDGVIHGPTSSAPAVLIVKIK